jgi:glycosyltransferase involved in cell wall biosynthesis
LASIEASVVLPALNENANLLVLVPKLLALDGISEVVIIDDGSTDGTQVEWKRRSKIAGGRVRYLRNPMRLGLACSTLQGVRAAKCSHVIVRDSDLNHDLRTIPELLKAARSGAQLCIASRYVHGRLPVGRWNDVFSIVLNRFLKLRFGHISDWTYGYYILDRSLMNGLTLDWVFRGRGEYTLRLYESLLQREQLRVLEVPTRVRERGEGQSSTRLLRHGSAYFHAYLDSVHFADNEDQARPVRSIELGRFGRRARSALIEKLSLQEPVLIVTAKGRAQDLTWLPPLVNSESYVMGESHTTSSGSYRTIFCGDLIQQLRWEDLISFFASMRRMASNDGKLYCLFPTQDSRFHRARRFFGLGDSRGSTARDLGVVSAAAQECGWYPVQGWGCAFGRKGVRAAEFHEHSPWHAHCLLEFAVQAGTSD